MMGCRGRRRAGRVLIAVGLIGSPAAAQQASVQGVVTSEDTGGPLEGVAVSMELPGAAVRGTLTDRNGFYQIGGLGPGSYTLRGRRIGEAPYEQSVTLVPGDRQTINFELRGSAVTLEGVVVSGERGAVIRDLGRQQVTPAELRLVPVPAGSGDLATYLQTLPGVTTTGDQGGQVFVRGGTSSENLALVDGIPIYQPFHIVSFFSVFPEDLISTVDFYAGGFGARYNGRTSSVLDVGLRDGDRNRVRAMGSVSPFLAEVLAEGPLGKGFSWLASARRSLIQETSSVLVGSRQPVSFESQLLKLSAAEGENLRCSVLALRTADRGRLDPERTDSHVSWSNRLLGGRCVTQHEGLVRLAESSFSVSAVDNAAVSRGTSALRSNTQLLQHEVHATGLIGAVPVYGGYRGYAELSDFDLSELYGVQRDDGQIFGLGGYVEAALPLGPRVQVRPGLVITASPRAAVEPRLRASWEPFGRPSERVQGALGLYRQDLIGTSDLRDVGSVFVAWLEAPDNEPVESVHASLGWQQSLPGGIRWSLEAFRRRMRSIPVPEWSSQARFVTRLTRADGSAHGVDARIEYGASGFYGFIGYGYSRTRYEVMQPEFEAWFGAPLQSYHPPHDRRHQVNAVGRMEVGRFQASARWQFGSGLPFTRPLGFDEGLDYTTDLPDVVGAPGPARLIVDRPFNGRLPAIHRLDLSLQGHVDLRPGRLTAQIGAVNAYDRRNMFYYDLFSGRRVDQLPLVPYAALTLRSRR